MQLVELYYCGRRKRRVPEGIIEEDGSFRVVRNGVAACLRSAGVSMNKMIGFIRRLPGGLDLPYAEDFTGEAVHWEVCVYGEEEGEEGEDEERRSVRHSASVIGCVSCLEAEA